MWQLTIGEYIFGEVFYGKKLEYFCHEKCILHFSFLIQIKNLTIFILFLLHILLYLFHSYFIKSCICT